jgi:hypothetical protein
MLLVPLIGAIDTHRAEQIICAVLEAISVQRAQTVLWEMMRKLTITYILHTTSHQRSI